jgi:LmbE family N-acetylglucosaminyl deacetylase
MKNILVVAAHPDDEILGCGGTIAKHANQGDQVFIIILGEGVTSRDNARLQARRKREILLLREQAKKAAKTVGAKKVLFHNIPDNRFDTLALLDIVKLIEHSLESIKPDIVFTHSNADLNIDHVITHRAVLTATRPFPGQSVKELYAFEVPSATEWAFQKSETSFQPNVFVDIEGTLAKKLKALAAYQGEMRQFPHPRSLEAVEILAKQRGNTAGSMASEAFVLIRKMC